MNLSTIDIRLLLVFEALMRERSVSRAAHDIGMSQPAVSRALNILRQMLKDELFVRSPGGMLPTAQARHETTPHKTETRAHAFVAKVSHLWNVPRGV